MSTFNDEEVQEMKKRQIRENFEKYQSIYKKGTKIQITTQEVELFSMTYGPEIEKNMSLKKKIMGRTFSVVQDCGFLIRIKVSSEILKGEILGKHHSLLIQRGAILPTDTTEYYSSIEEYYFSEWQM